MRPQKFTDVPSTRKPSSLRLRLQAGADEPRPNVGEIQKNHPNPAQPCANSSKRCIKRASSPCPYRAQYRLKAVVQAPLEDHVSESAAPIMRLQAVKPVGFVIEGVE